MLINISAHPVDKKQQQRLGFYDGFTDPGRLPEILDELYKTNHVNMYCNISEWEVGPVFSIHFARDLQAEQDNK